jgi:hypothetical protein
MKRLLAAVAMFAFVFLPTAATAQSYDAEQLRKVDQILVGVSGDDKDGCLPSQKDLKVKVEAILQQSGIAVETKFAKSHNLRILLRGTADTSSPSMCDGSALILLIKFTVYDDIRTENLEIITRSGSGPISASKSDFQVKLRVSVISDVTALANEILKARAR